MSSKCLPPFLQNQPLSYSHYVPIQPRIFLSWGCEPNKLKGFNFPRIWLRTCVLMFGTDNAICVASCSPNQGQNTMEDWLVEGRIYGLQKGTKMPDGITTPLTRVAITKYSLWKLSLTCYRNHSFNWLLQDKPVDKTAKQSSFSFSMVSFEGGCVFFWSWSAKFLKINCAMTILELAVVMQTCFLWSLNHLEPLTHAFFIFGPNLLWVLGEKWVFSYLGFCKNVEKCLIKMQSCTFFTNFQGSW